MELRRLYQYLIDGPRDARWMLRKVGPDYLEVVEKLRSRGWPVGCRLQDVGGLHRAVFFADLQGELFPVQEKKKRRRRRRRPAGLGVGG